ncbi:MAG TPA: alkaline phosphatase D family protein, partial [Baekduia sp.]|nr:alkaline phosphatase D family protein [Baekduia sp.]
MGGAGAAGIYLFGTPALTSAAVRRLGVASDVKFASGVASGQIAQRAATIWTQVDGLGANAKLNYQVATDPGFTNVIRNGKVAVDAASGTARLRLTNKKADGTLVSKAKRLKPGERYYYRFFNSNDTAQSIVGRFRTALPPDSNEKLKIAFFACQDYGTGFYTAHRDMAKQDVDMVVALGDYMYENSFFVGAIRDLPKTPDGQVRTLDEYRNQYRTYNSDADLQAVRAMAPMTVIWDDHEVEDNYAGDLPGGYFADPAADGTPARTFESTGDPQFSFDQRRKNAYKAFFEVHPVIRNPAEADRTYGSIRNGQVE